MFFADKITFPASLDSALRSHFANPAALAGALRALWPELAEKRGQAAKKEHYSFTPEAVRAYAAYYLPANLLKFALIPEEMRLMNLPFPGNLRILDVGCGPGTALWGFHWWAQRRGFRGEYLGLDRSPLFLKEAQALAARLPGSPFTTTWKKADVTDGKNLAAEIAAYRPNILLFSQSWSEFASTDPAWLAAWLPEWQKNAARGPAYLLIVEPGSKAASRQLLATREILRADPKLRILLPCLSNRPCGALARPEDWCHEETACSFPAWHEALGEAAGLRKEALIFSYLVAGDAHSAPEIWPADAARAVSQRLERKGQVECWFCFPEGKQAARVQYSKKTAANESFLDVRRGEIFTTLELGPKKDVLEMKRAASAAAPEESVLFPD